MRLVITGATGFIGKHLVDEVKDKYDVICLTRGDGSRVHDNVTYIKTSYETDDLRRILQDDDIVIHLAGQRLTKSDPNPKLSSFLGPNIEVTENLISVSVEVGVKQFILASTIGVYSPQDTQPFAESLIANPNNVYGLSKLIGEKLIQLYCSGNKTRATILRFSQCYGVGEKETPVLMKFIKLARAKQKLTAVDNEFYLDELYIKDAIEVIILAIDNQIEGLYNVGGGKAYSILDMAEQVNTIFENVGNLDVINDKKVNNTHNFMSNGKVNKELNWYPRYSLESGLIDMKEIYNTRSYKS